MMKLAAEVVHRAVNTFISVDILTQGSIGNCVCSFLYLSGGCISIKLHQKQNQMKDYVLLKTWFKPCLLIFSFSWTVCPLSGSYSETGVTNLDDEANLNTSNGKRKLSNSVRTQNMFPVTESKALCPFSTDLSSVFFCFLFHFYSTFHIDFEVTLNYFLDDIKGVQMENTSL